MNKTGEGRKKIEFLRVEVIGEAEATFRLKERGNKQSVSSSNTGTYLDIVLYYKIVLLFMAFLLIMNLLALIVVYKMYYHHHVRSCNSNISV